MHSFLSMGWLSREPTLPVRVYWFLDGLYIITTSEDYKYLLNTKILKIGDTDIYQVIDMINLKEKM